MAAKSLIPSLRFSGILPQNGRILLNLTVPYNPSLSAREMAKLCDLTNNELIFDQIERIAIEG